MKTTIRRALALFIALLLATSGTLSLPTFAFAEEQAGGNSDGIEPPVSEDEMIQLGGSDTDAPSGNPLPEGLTLEYEDNVPEWVPEAAPPSAESEIVGGDSLPLGNLWTPGDYLVSDDTAIEGDVTLCFDGTHGDKITLTIAEGATLSVSGAILCEDTASDGWLTIRGGGALICDSIKGYFGLTIGGGADGVTVEADRYVSPRYDLYLMSGTVCVGRSIESVNGSVRFCGGACNAKRYVDACPMIVADGLTYTVGTDATYTGKLAGDQLNAIAGQLMRPCDPDAVYIGYDPSEDEADQIPTPKRLLAPNETDAEPARASQAGNIVCQASPAEGGSIASVPCPDGSFLKLDDLFFSVTTNTGYSLQSMKYRVDGGAEKDLYYSSQYGVYYISIRDMPDSYGNLTVTAYFDKGATLVASPAEGGSIASVPCPDGSFFNPDDLFFSVTTNTGYNLQSMKYRVDGGAEKDLYYNSQYGVYYISIWDMPDSYGNLTVTAYFDKGATLVASPVAGGSIVSVPVPDASGFYEDDLCFSVTVNPGYVVSGVKYRVDNDGEKDMNYHPGHSVYYFSKSDIPDDYDNLTVTAYFQSDTSYSIAFADGISNGTVTASVNGVSVSEANGYAEVCLVANPESGYDLASLSVTDADGNPVTVSGNTFTMPGSKVTVDAAFAPLTDVGYIDYVNGVATSKTLSASSYTALASGTTTLNNGWYVVAHDVNMGDTRLEVSGTARLVLCDGATLTVPMGVHLASGNELSIYGQTSGTGKLYAGTTNGEDETCSRRRAGIGGNYNQKGGKLVVNGGAVTAIGGYYGAGIGGGDEGAGGEVTVNGGRVEAIGGSSGAGIGGGSVSAGGEVTVNGGRVEAIGGYYGAGIGGGSSGAGGEVTVNGGAVTAIGKGGGAGIGGGDEGAGGTVEVNGGKVEATGSDGGAGIGSGYGYSGNTPGTLSVGFKNNSDSLKASSYTGSVTVKENCAITYQDGNGDWQVLTHADTVSNDAVAGRTLSKYVQSYAVTVNTFGYGTAQASTSSAKENDTVTLTTLQPGSGNWSLESVTWNDGADHAITPVNGVYSFTMPGHDVTVTVVFTHDPAHFSVNAAGTEYTIQDAEGWEIFCDCLNCNETYNRFCGKTVKLGADIDITRMAGSSGHDFCGTFDGDKHTINITKTDGVCVPFCYVSSTKANETDAENTPTAIKNLRVTGTIKASSKYAAGLISQMWGTVTIENCRVSVTINSSVGGDGTHGGLVAVNYGDLTIKGCVFDGKLLSTGETDTTNCGGFVGWGGTVKIIDSLYAPAEIGNGETEVKEGNPEDHPSATFARDSATITNSYYTRALGKAQGKQAHTIAAGDNTTLAFTGTATAYDVSGITVYENNSGLKYGDTYCAGAEDTVNLAVEPGAGYVLDALNVVDGSGQASAVASSQFQMPADDVTVSIVYKPESVSFINFNNDGEAYTHTLSASSYTYHVLTPQTTTLTGCYLVTEDVDMGSTRLVVSNKAQLILYDGKTLTVPAGIKVLDGNKLSIYAQNTDEDIMGALVINANAATNNTVADKNAGIGGDNNQKGGTITINGGMVKVAGGKYGAGIGGGNSGAGGEVTVNGGKVTVLGGQSAAGIGGGASDVGGTVIINGGWVNVTGGRSGGVGIGGGADKTNTGTLTVNFKTDDDSLKANSYGGTFKVEDGQYIKYEVSKVKYFLYGTLSNLSAIAGKTLRKASPHAVIIKDDIANGRLTADMTLAEAGDTVSVTVEPNQGFALNTLSYTSNDSEPVDILDNKFAMLAGDVTVVATFKRVFTVSFAAGGGSGSMDAVTVVANAEYALPVCGFTAPEGQVFKAWSIDGVEYAPDTAITVDRDITATAVWQTADGFARLNLITTSFKDRLQLNFYYIIPQAVLADEGAYLRVTKGGKSVNLPVKDAEIIVNDPVADKIGCYPLSYSIEATEARDVVNVRLFYGDDTAVATTNSSGSRDMTESGYDITAMAYLDYMVKNGSSEGMRTLAQACKDYCTAAQLHFQYNVESIAEGDGVSARVDAVKSSDLNDYVSIKEGTKPEGIDLDVMTVMFDSDNSFRLYFTYDDDSTRTSYEYKVDGSTATLKQRATDKKNYITKTGVPARLLHKPHTYAISKGGDTYTLTASMMTYAKAAIENGSPTMQTLARAFYLYNLEAKAYFGDDE